MISVQNRCETSRLRTLRTTWFTPRGVWAVLGMVSSILGNADSAAGQLGFEIERPRTDRLAIGNRPEQLELEAIGIFRVEREARPVIRLADQRARADQPLPRARQVGEVTDLPGRVIHAGDAFAGAPDAGVLEQAEMMIVGRARDLEERSTREAALHLEAQHVEVEARAALDVGDVEDQMLQATQAEAPQHA